MAEIVGKDYVGTSRNNVESLGHLLEAVETEWKE